MVNPKTKVSSKIVKKLYKGEIELVFNKNGHRYTVADKPCVGVTTILSSLAKPALIPWAVNMTIGYLQENIKAGKSYDEVQIGELLKEAKGAYRKKKEAAADLGSLVHKWIEDYIKGLKPELPINPQMKLSIDAFLKWEKDNKVKFIESERVVYSRKYNFAGTCDFTCEINGKKYIGDIKTSNAIYSEYLLQVSAYRYAMQEEDNNVYDGMLIIRVPKTAEAIEVFEFNDYQENAKAFIYLTQVYNRLQILKNISLKGVQSK